jgi:hypothetical protein
MEKKVLDRDQSMNYVARRCSQEEKESQRQSGACAQYTALYRHARGGEESTLDECLFAP